MSINIAINGAAGRMGRNLIKACLHTQGLSLGAAIEHADSEFLGLDAGALANVGTAGVPITASLEEAVAHFDVLIDFTRPEPSLNALDICLVNNKAMVIGTTGYTDEQKVKLEQASTQMPIVLASNFSVGVNVLFKLLEVASKAFGDSVDIEIQETHHRFKVDAPSGTALSMGEVIADTLGRDLKACAVYGREGVTGERDRQTIGFSTVRAGDVIGDHTAMFADLGERVEITHKASDRIIYANGAMRAARWLSQQPNGLYDMHDVLGFK